RSSCRSRSDQRSSSRVARDIAVVSDGEWRLQAASRGGRGNGSFSRPFPAIGVPPADTGPLTLHLLGAVDLDGVEGDVASRLFAQPRLTALLAVLAVPEPGRFVRRDRVVGLLWPDLDQSHARAALRKAVHAIRSALGDDVIV